MFVVASFTKFLCKTAFFPPFFFTYYCLSRAYLFYRTDLESIDWCLNSCPHVSTQNLPSERPGSDLVSLTYLCNISVSSILKWMHEGLLPFCKSIHDIRYFRCPTPTCVDLGIFTFWFKCLHIFYFPLPIPIIILTAGSLPQGKKFFTERNFNYKYKREDWHSVYLQKVMVTYLKNIVQRS